MENMSTTGRGTAFVLSTSTLAKSPQASNALPSDTNLLLTKNYFEIIIFGKITNLTRNSLKMSFFPGHFGSSKSLKITKNNSQGINFVIIHVGGYVGRRWWHHLHRDPLAHLPAYMTRVISKHSLQPLGAGTPSKARSRARLRSQQRITRGLQGGVLARQALVGGFEKGLAGGGWRQTNPQKEPKKLSRNVSPSS